MATTDRMSPETWVDGALDALLAEGPDGVAVQPVARRIGATKGSFYWHFGTRDDLLRATLQRWYDTRTEDVITAVDATSGDPGQKARLFLRRVTTSRSHHPGEMNLLASAGQPEVYAALDRATRRRIGYVAELLGEAGQPARVATRRATLAYATYLGHAQLAHTTPDVLPRSDSARRSLLDEMTAGLLAGPA